MAERKSEELLALFDTAPLNHRYWVTFGLLASGAVLDYFDFFIVGYLIAQLGPQYPSTILLAAGIGAIAGALIWGPLADHLGRKRQLVFGYLICAVGAGGISLIPDGDWVMFAMLRFIVGFGLAAGTVPSSTMIIEITPTRVRTLVASLAVLFSTVGTFSASAMGATLYTWLGWRNVGSTCRSTRCRCRRCRRPTRRAGAMCGADDRLAAPQDQHQAGSGVFRHRDPVRDRCAPPTCSCRAGSATRRPM